MLPTLIRSRRFGALRLASLAILSSLLATGCASAPASDEPAMAAAMPDEPAMAEGSKAAAADAPKPAAAAEAQYEWLVDEQGHRFRVEPLPKDGPFLRLDDGRIRTRWGVTVDPFSEDDDFIYYKLYDTSQIKSGDWEQKLTAERKREIVRDYEFSTPDTSRVELVAFDDGLPSSGQWRQGFKVVDMNGDGHLDIVHGPVRKGARHPVIFLGDGAGGWTQWDVRYPAVKMDYGDIAVADFDGDGHQDLALAMHLTGIRVMVWDGEGGFRLWTEGTDYGDSARGGPPKYSSRTIEAVDWNRDGRMDLLTLGEGPRLERNQGNAKIDPDTGAYGPVVYLNQGDGTWQRRDQGTGSNQVFGDDLVVGDLNGDGEADFVTGSSQMGRKGIVFHHGAGDSWDLEQPELVRDRSYLRAVDIGDFDGDGRQDLALAFLSAERDTWRTGIDVLLNRGRGSWERRHVFHTENREGVWGLGAGDVDGDGKADLVAATGWRDLWVFLGAGDGSFARLVTDQPILEEAPGCRGYHVALADLDHDGDDEVVVGFAGEGQGWTGLMSLPGCPGAGSLRAWNVRAR